MAVMLDDLRAEARRGEFAIDEAVGRLLQGVWYARQVAGGVAIAAEYFRRLDLVTDAIQP